MKKILIALLCSCSLALSAQEIAKDVTLPDGTSVVSTSLCSYAQGKGLLARSLKMGMSYITFDTRESTFAIIIPLVSDHYVSLPAGRHAFIKQANGHVMMLENVHIVYREDNARSLDDHYTVCPEYAVTEQQLQTLSQSEVVHIRLETDIPGEYKEIGREDYPRKWQFNKYLQQCYNVLIWRLSEKRRGH